MKQDFRCGCWLMEKPETAMKSITRNLDREIWRDLMGVHLENGIYGHSRFCNTDFDDKLACLNLSGV